MMIHEDWDSIAKQNSELSALAEAGRLYDLVRALREADWDLSAMCDYEYQQDHCRAFWGPTAVHSEQDMALIRSWIPDFSMVADVGFGYGYLLQYLAQTMPQEQLIGIDSSERACTLMREKLPDASVIIADAQDISAVPTGSCEVVILMEVVEHLSPAAGQRVLSEAYRICAKDGSLVVSTRINENLGRSLLRCPSCQQVQHPAGHIRSFSETLLRAELQIAGWWCAEIERSPGGILTRCVKRS